MAPEDHAEHGPSSLPYKEKCSHYTSKDSPGEYKPAAEEGTLLHLAAETGDLSNLDEEQSDCVNLVLSYRDSLIQKHSKVLLEEKVHVGDITWGTADVSIVTGDHVDVVDYKFGRNPVDSAETNAQGWAYLLGIWDHPEARHCTTGGIHFLLPRRNEISYAEFDRADSEQAMLEKISSIVTQAENPDAPYNTGTHCRYCSLKAECPAFTQHALQHLPKAEALPLADIENFSLAKPENVAKLLDLKPMMEDFFKRLNKKALEFVQSGSSIPGYELMTRNSSRTLRDVASVWATVEEYGVDQFEFLDKCRINVGDLDNLVKDASARGAKEKTVKEVHDKLTEDGLEVQAGTIQYLKKKK